MVDGGHTHTWTHTQTDRPPSAAAPQMPYGIVIIHGVSQLLAGPDKWNYTAQMRWLHTCVYVCCVFVCLCVCVSVCLRATRPVSAKEK